MSMIVELELSTAIEKQLSDANINFQKEVVVGDTRPDFAVTAPNGDLIIIEAKAWEESTANTARALHQVERYKQLSKAFSAIVVTAVSQTISVSAGAVVPLAELVSTLTTLMASAKKGKRTISPVPRAVPKKNIFASMPFASKYDDTFLVAIEPAALANGAIAERVDHNGAAGNVVIQIQSMIRAAKVVVADLSDSRPNVLHEVGFAEALGKPVIQICATPGINLPFNVRNNQTWPYSIGQTTRLRRRLETEIQKVI